MDISTLIGLALGVFFMIYGIGAENLSDFYDLDSILITIGGSIASLLISYPMNKVITSFKAYSHIFKKSNLNETTVIKKIIELSNVARKEGLLALEEVASDLQDDFLRKGILLIVDGTDPELVRNIMETELAFLENRHKDIQGFWESWASLTPAWGMIGTLIGLINMLKAMDDPSSIGPAMSVALITTLYGSFVANFIAQPAANKMKTKSDLEVLLKEVMIEGLLSIQAGENPRVIEEKLKAFLSPAQRKEFEGEEEKVGEE